MQKLILKITPILLLFLLMLGAGPLAAQQKFGGVGLLLDYHPEKNGEVLVYSVSYKSPADKAKIRRGDRLLKIDGQAVDGADLKAIAEKIRGPIGSSLVLTIESKGQVRDVPLLRAEITQGPLVSVPPPGAFVPQGSSSSFLSDADRALIKAKISGLTTDEQRQNMLLLLTALKEKKISKDKFMEILQSQF